MSSEVRRTDNGDIVNGLITLRFQAFNLADDTFAVNYFAKNDMLSVKMRRRYGCHEELGPIGTCKKVARLVL